MAVAITALSVPSPFFVQNTKADKIHAWRNAGIHGSIAVAAQDACDVGAMAILIIGTSADESLLVDEAALLGMEIRLVGYAAIDDRNANSCACPAGRICNVGMHSGRRDIQHSVYGAIGSDVFHCGIVREESPAPPEKACNGRERIKSSFCP